MDVEIDLPYEPLNFVHTTTIGLNNHEASTSDYTWSYQDILKPNSTYPYLYYLFHIPPIYNWFRTQTPHCFEVQQLEKYLNFIQQKNALTSLRETKENLLRYSEKWQIVKLCLKAHIQIQQTNKQCSHLPKTKQWSTIYQYDWANSCLNCGYFFCKNCQQKMKGKVSVIKYPFAPMLDRYVGESFINSKEKNDLGSPMIYHLTVVFEENNTFVKAANKVWYKIDMKTGLIKMGKYEGSKKAIGLFVYMREQGLKNVGILKEARKMERGQKIKPKEEKEQKRQIFKEHKIEPQTKIINRNVKTMYKTIDSDKEELVSLKKQHNKIILSGKGNQAFSYKEETEKRYDKPKQKDEYEKEYDKGKTKKIKKKVQYEKVNFNKIYTEVRNMEEREEYGRDRGRERGKRKKFRRNFERD